MAVERYIGGGTIHFTPWTGGAYGAEVEIGEVQSATLKISATYADAMSKDNGVSKKVDKTLTATDASLSFTTQNVNKENMALAMMGTSTTQTFAVGDTLPDGIVATVSTVVPVTIAGNVSKIEGKIRIVGVNISGAENPVLEVPMVVLTPSGDIRDYFADKHTTIGFDGEILEVDGEYFKEYFMAKA